MEYHGIPWNTHGILMESSWKARVFYNFIITVYIMNFLQYITQTFNMTTLQEILQQNSKNTKQTEQLQLKLDAFIESTNLKLDQILIKLNRLDNHIDFVEDTYEAVRHPLKLFLKPNMSTLRIEK